MTGILRRTGSVAPVGGGLLLLGASSYVVLALAGHVLSPRDYAALGSLYLITAVVGPGVFGAVEQETNREVSARRARAVGTRPAVAGSAVVAGVLALLVAAVLVALAPLLVPRVLAGAWSLLDAALVAAVGSAAVYLLRGVFAAQRRYGWYAASLAAEGLARIVLCAAVAVLGTATAGAYGLAFALGTGVAALICWPGSRAGDAGPPVGLRGMGGRVGLLALANGLTFVVANVAPLVLTARLPDEPAVAASFVSLFVLARLPTFLLAPLQAYLLPSLTAAVERGDTSTVRARLRAVGLAVAGVGVVGVVAAGLLGPWAARVFFDAPLDLPRGAAVLLGVSTAAIMGGLTLQPALVALGRHRWATFAWLAGGAAFAVLLALPLDPVTGAVAAQVVGPILVVAIMVAGVRVGLREPDPVGPCS